MKKNSMITLRLDVSDEIRLEKLISNCENHRRIRVPSKSDVFRYALRFLCQLEDESLFRVISNWGNPNPFEVKMKTK